MFVNERSLVVFLEVYRERSMRAAALNLYVSPQSVSKTILDLEAEVRETLFVREQKHLVPTDYAIELKKHAEKILSEYSLIRGHSLGQPPPRQLLKIFCTYGVTELLGAQFVRDFNRVHKHILLYLAEIPDGRALELLQKNEGAAAILSDPSNGNLFTSRHIYTSEYCFVVGKQHPLSGAKSIGIRDLDAVDIVTKGGEFQLYINQMAGFLDADVHPNVVLETTSYHLSLQMAAENIAVAFIPKYMAQRYRPDNAVIIPSGRYDCCKPFYFVTKNSGEIGEETKRFRDFLTLWVDANIK
ncbi:LysR family transcriptional regulator [Oscillospiraceae bacterium 52-8]|nr:LysR family transcriptional regulator [Bittarella massiliensis (ex Durand et al. 2017)]